MAEHIHGAWDDNTRWEIYPTSELPATDLITTAFCVAFTDHDEVVLARSKRGWGLVGGHVERGETVIEALERESLEEGGFTPQHPELFAMMEVTSSLRTLRPHSSTEYYPFPKSYQVYYWASIHGSRAAPNGEEILESRTFSLKDAEALGIRDFPIILLGYQAYRAVADTSS